MNKFNYAISNPPYQEDVQKIRKRVTMEIFPYFQHFGTFTSERTAMIYPATWQKNLSENLGLFLLKNGLKRSNNYNGQTIFYGIYIVVSITMTENNYSGTITVNDKRVIDRDITHWVDSDKSFILYNATKNMPKIRGGVMLAPTETNVQDSNLDYYDAPNEKNNIRMLIKSKPGTQPDSDWYYLNRKQLLNKYPDYHIDKYKVCVRSAGLGRQTVFTEIVFTRRGGQGLRTAVFAPGDTHGKTWDQLAEFNTLEEAQNYSNYLNTMLIAHLAHLDYSRKTFGSYIPDLKDYSNKNALFMPDDELGTTHEYYHVDLEHRLYKYFNLSPDDIKLLEG